ncbi:MAG: glycosyltransferase family 2 protein [Nanoarchaeota archaeon]
MEKYSYAKILIYSFFIALSIYLIILVKATGFSKIDAIYVYSILITTFMFSRVMGSIFYESPELNEFRPYVTFIIPCKNEEKAIYQTIKKCFEVDYDLNLIEVIAINDGSSDDTLKEMERAKRDLHGRDIFIINWEKNRGKRHGMVEGFRLARGEICIQLDSDSYLDKDALKLIVAPFVDFKIGAVVGHTLPSNKDENLLTKMQTAYYFMSFRALKSTESIFDKVFCCSGCFSAYKKSYVIPVLDSFLAEKFFGRPIVFGDDRALTNLILRQGYKTIYHDKAKAFTIVPNNLKSFLKQQVRWKKGWLINSLRISDFIVKDDPYVAFTYFIPLIVLTLLTPFIVIKALVINPIFFGIIPILYLVGVMLVSLLLYFHYGLFREEENKKYGKYMFLWSILNLTILSYILIYALFDLRNMKWGTR